MSTRSSKSATTADEVAAIEDLVNDLERRLRRLSGLSSAARREVSDAGSDIGGFVSDALADIMKRVRESSATLGQSVTDEVSRTGSVTVRKVIDEVEHRPLMMLAIAAGVGYLAGYANRR